jgi:hypothetical protein
MRFLSLVKSVAELRWITWHVKVFTPQTLFAFHTKILVEKSIASSPPTTSLSRIEKMSSTPSTDTLPQTPTRRQSAPAAGSTYFAPRRSSTPTGGRPLSAIPERTARMIPIDEDDEPVPVVVNPPKSSTLHHLPIAFALLPAAAGLLVGGGEKWTDVMLLGLAGVYLNWLVKCNSSVECIANRSSMGMVPCLKNFTAPL